MKSVLISIQPYWVFLIIAQKMGWNIPHSKTAEMRKTYPKEKSWNKKAIIYCTQDKKSFYSIPKEYQGSMRPLLGKVVGEFLCDDLFTIGANAYGHEYIERVSCLSHKELENYQGEKTYIWGWHISDLKIYDEPKELKRFGKFECEYCGSKKECFAPETIYDCSLQRIDTHLNNNNMYRCDGDFLSLKRPPQSWCYVKETN